MDIVFRLHLYTLYSIQCIVKLLTTRCSTTTTKFFKAELKKLPFSTSFFEQNLIEFLFKKN